MSTFNKSSFAKSPDLAVPWEQALPPDKRRFDVRRICGGPGKSGMGIVYLAYDREHQAPFAIKTFQDKYLQTPQAVERFKKEAEVWVELGKHKNIVSAKWVENYLGRPYIFMEMVAGGEQYGADLSGWIHRKGLNLPLMINFAIQFCRGMAHAEKRFKEMGRVFIHRDIKPENIMVTKDKVVKVTDFGLVQTVRDATFSPELVAEAGSSRFSVVSQQGICGTPFYMSPEQIQQGSAANTPLDVRSDLYAFGCVLYAMVTSAPPFYKLPFDFPRYCEQTLYVQPTPVISGDREFDEVILRLLQKVPDQRGCGNFAELEETFQKMAQQITGQRLKEESQQELVAEELVNRGVSFANLGQLERALADYTCALDLNPGMPDAYHNRGNAYVALGYPERAISEYTHALDFNPRNAEDIYTNRGSAYAELGQMERAMTDYTRALELNPEYVNAYYSRAKRYVTLGQSERALADYTCALKLNPADADVYYNRGLIYDELGHAEQALSDYTHAVEINPSFAYAYYNRGLLYNQLGQMERALADYTRALDLNPIDASAHYNRGNVYAVLGQSEMALSDYTRTLELNPDHANAYCNRGIFYCALGQPERAIQDFARFIELAPPQDAQQVAAAKQEIRRLEGLIRGR